MGKTFFGLTALSRVSFTVNAGEILAMIGPNGAGKTTLFNAIAGGTPPTSGTIRFVATPTQHLPSHRIASAELIRTFQNVRLFGRMTALENVMVGLHQHTRAGIVVAALRLPSGESGERESRVQAGRLLSSVGLGDRGGLIAGNLPLGQQRLVEIARDLVATCQAVVYRKQESFAERTAGS